MEEQQIKQKETLPENGEAEDIKVTVTEKPKLKSKLIEYFEAVLFALLVAAFLKIFFVEAYRIPTGSMMNTLLVGDFLLVNKIVYGATTPRSIPFTQIRIPYFTFPTIQHPERGDVVVFDYPGDINVFQSKEVTNFIKRLVGEPGDSIKIVDKVLYVNGEVFPNHPDALFSESIEKSPNLGIFPPGSGWNNDNYGPIRVPQKDDIIKITPDNMEAWKMFIMREGHSIRLTADNKVFIDETEKSDYKVEKNYYFMMGDNRNNSSDSRYWGFLSEDRIIGEALMIYWSWDPNIPYSNFGRLFDSIRWNRIAKIIH